MKNVDEPKVPSQSHTTKQKSVSTDTKAPVKQPHVDTDVPVTKNLPEGKASELKKVEADIEKPKNKQVADGEKPPKSEVLEDNPNLKEKELDNFKKYEDDVDASKKKKMKDDADAEVKKGKDHDSKSKALVMARIIAEANDKIDTPVPVLLAELRTLKAVSKGIDNFIAEEGQNGVFQIYMIGSKYLVDGRYTESGPIESKVLKKSKSGYGLLEGTSKSGWQHIVDGHIIGKGTKHLFPKGLSASKIKNLIIESVDYGVTVAKQGNRLEIIYKLSPAKYGIKEMRVWVNKVTREIETAYPTKGSSVFENVIEIP